jgi:hypothetical protein
VRYLLLIVLFSSCLKEYSRETNVNVYDTTLFGNGDETYWLKMPQNLTGQKVSISFYITLYSSQTDSIGRNDYIKELPFHMLKKKYTGNPVYKNQLTLSGTIVLPGSLFYVETTYYTSGVMPVFTDTVRIEIKN